VKSLSKVQRGQLQLSGMDACRVEEEREEVIEGIIKGVLEGVGDVCLISIAVLCVRERQGGEELDKAIGGLRPSSDIESSAGTGSRTTYK